MDGKVAAPRGLTLPDFHAAPRWTEQEEEDAASSTKVAAGIAVLMALDGATPPSRIVALVEEASTSTVIDHCVVGDSMSF